MPVTDFDTASMTGSTAENDSDIAFDSSASNLVPGDTNGASDIFLRGPLEW